MKGVLMLRKIAASSLLRDSIFDDKNGLSTRHPSGNKSSDRQPAFRRTLLNSSSLITSLALGLVVAMPADVARAQSTIPTLAGGTGGGGSGAQASTGAGTDGTGLGYNGGTGGGAGSVGGTGGDGGVSGTTVPNSGGAGGTAGGGAGGNGADYIAIGGGYGGGGGGGAHASTGTTLPGGSSQTGGAGGTGGTGGDPTVDNHNGGAGGGGGGGGFGAVVEANGALGTLTIGLTGGAGGAGGNTTAYGYNYAGAGGTGGGGLYLSSTQDTSLTVSGVVTGGAGGAGGTTGNQYAIVNGGAGGSGIYAGNSSAITTLTLTGTAQAIGGSGGVGSSADYAGAAGVGIAGENLSIILAAGTTVRAGQSSKSFSPRNAIQFTGGTNSLELQGNGGTSGQTYATIDGNVVGSGTTTLKLTGAGGTFDLSLLNPEQGFSQFSGVTVNSTGKWIVGGTPTDTATWTVTGGTLSNGLAGSLAATLGGDTSIGAGAGLSATAVSGESAFTINGDLSLNATSALNITLGAPSVTALITVTGDLTLNGTLNIADSGTIAPGTYTLIGYSGSYSGTGLTIGTTPDNDYKYVLSTATANLVTLSVNLNGLYWNGTTTSGTGVVVGGNGTWTAGPTTNWLPPDKTANVASSDNMPALFAGTAGTVTVNTTDGAVSSEGLRFETTGYTLVGATVSDTLALAITSGIPNVNVVGDSTVATIALPLTGTQGLEKTGTGRLILTGANTYTGNTKISAGTLQLGDGTTTGTVVGNITNNAALAFNPAGFTAAFAGVISGTGTVEKAGAGWQTLSGNNTYSGVTTVSAGMLLVSSNTALGTTAGRTVVSSGATLGLYGTGITVAEPLTLAGFGASFGLGSAGALASFRGNSVSAGTNTVSGAITLAADASIVNSGGVGDILNLTGTITGDGKSLYLGSSTGAINTVSGQINTGSGGVGIASGSWVFSNTSGYTGTTVVAAGAKLTLAGPIFSTIGGDINNNGTLSLNGQYYNGVISGSGNVNVGPLGSTDTSEFGGKNTYTGETTVLSGVILTVKQSSGLGSATRGTTVSSGGQLRFELPSGGVISEPLTISGNGLYEDGALVFEGGQITYQGAITLADNARIRISDSTALDLQGNITSSGKTLTLNVDATSTTKTISGVVALGSGGVTIESGNWIFSAKNTYTGVTTINSTQGIAGKLLVNGSLAGGVTVNRGGTLAGSGIVKGTKVNNGGTIAPGNSPGTLTVDGTLEMETGSTYQVDVTPAGEHDLLIVTGNVTIADGTTLEVIAEPGVYAASSTLTILSTSGTITGGFTNVISDYAFLTPSIESDGQNIILTLLYNDALFTSYARTPNQFAVAGAAQTLGAGNPVFDAIVSLPADAVPNAYNQLSGEIYPSINTVIQQQSAYLRDAVGARLRQSVTGPTATALSYAAKAQGPEAAQLAEGLTPTLWMQGFGGWGDTSGNGNAASISNTIGGVIAGLDVAVTDNVRAGLVGGFSRSSFDVDARNSSGDMDNYDIGIYAGGQFGAVALRGGASYSWHDVSVNRTVAFPGFVGLTEGDYTVGTTQLFGEVAYDFTVGAFEFEPFAGLAYLHLSGETFTETGTQTSGAALGVSLASQDTLYSTLGIRAATSVTVGGYALTPSVTLGWQHAFGDTVSAATMLFQGGSTPFQVTGVPIAEDTLLLGAGLAYDISDRASLQVNYTGQLAGDASQNALTAQFSLRF